MAKALGPKSRLIRDALAAHPEMGNTALAALINSSPARKEDGIEVTMQDVASQKQALKKAAESEPTAPAPKASVTAPAPVLAPVEPVALKPTADITDDLATIKRLVQKLGAEQVGKIAELFE